MILGFSFLSAHIHLELGNVKRLLLAENRDGYRCHVPSVRQHGNFQYHPWLQIERIEDAVLVGNGPPLRRIIVDIVGNLVECLAGLHYLRLGMIRGPLIDLRRFARQEFCIPSERPRVSRAVELLVD